MHPSYYNTVYLIIVSILTWWVYSKYRLYDGLEDERESQSDFICGCLTIFLILWIGLRPISAKYFTDSANYSLYYTRYFEGESFSFNWNTENILFDNLIAWWGSNYLGYTSFCLVISCIYFGAAYMGIRKLFPNHILAAYLVFLAAFSTFSYSTNGIKAGAAASLFILAMGHRDNLKVCIPLVLMSWGVHHSMIMVVAGFILTLFFKNTKLYFVFWGVCFVMAAAHITAFQHYFSNFTTEHGANYLLSKGGNDGTKGGFRIDFILYSAMPVLVGWYILFKRKLDVSMLYRNLLNLYLCLNGIWMLCMYASYTNRIAYLSWFLYPIVLIYPLLQEALGVSKYQMFAYISMGHLLFTLFMAIVY